MCHKPNYNNGGVQTFNNAFELILLEPTCLQVLRVAIQTKCTTLTKSMIDLALFIPMFKRYCWNFKYFVLVTLTPYKKMTVKNVLLLDIIGIPYNLPFWNFLTSILTDLNGITRVWFMLNCPLLHMWNRVLGRAIPNCFSIWECAHDEPFAKYWNEKNSHNCSIPLWQTLHSPLWLHLRHGTWNISKNHLLEVGLTQNQETMALRTFTTVDLFYFIMCEDLHE